MLPAAALAPNKPFRDYVLDNWGVEQGLPQITVTAITQDGEGYLWLGSQTGLARFDGVHFQNFALRDALGLDSGIQALLADDHGRLWVGTARSLLVLENGKLRNLTPPGKPGEPPPRFPVAALAFVDGQVLVAGPDGLYAPTIDGLRRVRPLPGPATSLLAGPDGLWIGSRGQVLQLVAGQLEPHPLPDGMADVAVNALAHFDGEVYASTRNGLLRLHDGQWTPVPGRDGDRVRAVEALAADHDGNLWLATPQYLERLRKGQPVERLQNTAGSIAIRAIFEDRDGNLWLGSQTEGITRAWSGYTRRLSHPDGLASPLLWAVAKAPDGGIWVGTSDGVEVWRDGRFQRVASGAQLPHPEAYSLLPEAGQVWVGTRAGVALLHPGRPGAELPPALLPLRNAQINGILRDHLGQLWFATSEGLFELDAHQQLTRYGAAQGLPDPRIRIVRETRDGHLLAGSPQGLYEWREGRMQAVGRTQGLPADIAVSAFVELADGRWVLGSSSGVPLWIFDGQRWRGIGENRGLPASLPFHLDEIDGQLWVAGMQGVYRLPLAQLDRALADPRARLAPELLINSGFDRLGGQQDKCCNGSGNNRGLLYQNELWLPTRDGALLVQTALPDARTPWPLRIETVQTDVGTLTPGRTRLQLPLDARTIRIAFSLPALLPAHPPHLRFRLTGFDEGWRELDAPNQRSIGYVNLPPGQYRFEVADFSRPNPLADTATLELEVPPHLRETLAFRMLAVLLLGALVWLGYLGLRLRYARQRAALELLVQERTQDLQTANARLKELSFTDPLTGLHNRRYLSQQIPIDLKFYERDAGYLDGSDALVFVLLDIDHFKLINDTWGHAAGDRVLEQFGQLLGELKRSGDYAARWGGEEFLLVLRPLPRDGLAQIGQRLCARIAAHPFDLGGGRHHRLTASIGLVEYPLLHQQPHLLDWEQLVSLADRALYRVKTSGRNGWMAYRPLPGNTLTLDPALVRGNPGWLLDNGVLEMFGEIGPDPHGGTSGEPAPKHPPNPPPEAGP